jgi:hypothetical protein
MKLATGTLLMISILVLSPFSRAQTKDIAIPAARAQAPAAAPAATPNSSADNWAVFNATQVQEQALRRQIHLMRPDILPLRVFFVPHWKYLAAARDFHLHVPVGYGSLMFTHLPSRTVFIDNDRYQGEDWLAHWIAHELGHLATNSAKEEDAERAGREFRKRFEDAQKKPH